MPPTLIYFLSPPNLPTSTHTEITALQQPTRLDLGPGQRCSHRIGLPWPELPWALRKAAGLASPRDEYPLLHSRVDSQSQSASVLAFVLLCSFPQALLGRSLDTDSHIPWRGVSRNPTEGSWGLGAQQEYQVAFMETASSVASC